LDDLTKTNKTIMNRAKSYSHHIQASTINHIIILLKPLHNTLLLLITNTNIILYHQATWHRRSWRKRFRKYNLEYSIEPI